MGILSSSWIPRLFLCKSTIETPLPFSHHVSTLLLLGWKSGLRRCNFERKNELHFFCLFFLGNLFFHFPLHALPANVLPPTDGFFVRVIYFFENGVLESERKEGMGWDGMGPGLAKLICGNGGGGIQG